MRTGQERCIIVSGGVDDNSQVLRDMFETHFFPSSEVVNVASGAHTCDQVGEFSGSRFQTYLRPLAHCCQAAF